MESQRGARWIVLGLLLVALVAAFALWAEDGRPRKAEAETRLSNGQAPTGSDPAAGARLVRPGEGESQETRTAIETPPDEPAPGISVLSGGPVDPGPALLPALPPHFQATVFGDVGWVGGPEAVDVAWELGAAELSLVLIDRTGLVHEPSTSGVRFEFVDLEPGEYWLQGGGDRTRPVEKRIELAAKENHRVDLEFVLNSSVDLRATTAGGEPLVWALEDLGPMRQLWTIATPWPDPQWEDMVAAERFARFRSHVWRSKSLREEAWDPDAGLDSREWAQSFGSLQPLVDGPLYVGLFHMRQRIALLTWKGDERVLEFRVDPENLEGLLGRLEVHVVDAGTGEFVRGGVFIWAFEGSINPHELPRGPLIQDPCPVGTFSLTIDHPDYGRSHHFLKVTGPDQDPHVIALSPGSETILVRVLHADGTPAADTNVSLLDGSRLADLAWASVGLTDASGEVDVPLPDVPSLLRASALDPDQDFDPTESGFAPEAKILASGNLRLVPGQIEEGLVLHLSSTSQLRLVPDPAFANGNYRVFDQHGYLMQAGAFHGSAPRRVKLIPGNYRLEVRDGKGAGPWVWQVDLGEDPLEWPVGP